MRKTVSYCLMFAFIISVSFSCAPKGWDVNDTWRPTKHKPLNLANPPKPKKRK